MLIRDKRSENRFSTEAISESVPTTARRCRGTLALAESTDIISLLPRNRHLETPQGFSATRASARSYLDGFARYEPRVTRHLANVTAERRGSSARGPRPRPVALIPGLGGPHPRPFSQFWEKGAACWPEAAPLLKSGEGCRGEGYPRTASRMRCKTEGKSARTFSLWNRITWQP